MEGTCAGGGVAASGAEGAYVGGGAAASGTKVHAQAAFKSLGGHLVADRWKGIWRGRRRGKNKKC